MGYMVDKIVTVMEKIREHYDHAFIITGSYLEKNEWNQLETRILSDNQISLLREVSEPLDWMRASDLFISNGGYNTLSEVVANNINAIVIPREISETEQNLHTQRFASEGYIRTFSLRESTITRLEQLVIEAMQYPIITSSCSVDYTGTNTVAKLIQDMLEN